MEPFIQQSEIRKFATKHSDQAAKELQLVMLTNECRICAVSVNLHGMIPSVEVKSVLDLIDPLSNNQFDTHVVFHCDGLLLCSSANLSRHVVWNPCNGQTRWIKAGRVIASTYVLGYYQDSKSSRKTYKVLAYSCVTKVSEIYDFSSDSWRMLDRGDISPGWEFFCSERIASLKGYSYWLASDVTNKLPGLYLLRFDFSTEKSSVLVALPNQSPTFEIVNFCVVREEKIAVLFQPSHTSKTEIWVTNKIDETNLVSWSKLLAFDMSPDNFLSNEVNFWLDDEKKVAFCCDRWINMGNTMDIHKIFTVGEDNKLTLVYSGFVSIDSPVPVILSYVPSLVQIDPVGGNKRKKSFS